MDMIEYKAFVLSRFIELVELTGLPISYIESETDISISNYYNIIKGDREPPISTIEKLGNLLELPLIRIFDPECDLKDYVRKSGYLEELLNRVAELNKNSISVARFIEKNLLQSRIFKKPVSVAEIRKNCQELWDKKVSSHDVATALDALVNKGKLEVSKMPIIKEDGSQGKRMVKYYFLPKSK